MKEKILSEVLFGNLLVSKSESEKSWLLPERAQNVDFISANLFYVTSIPD